MIRIIRSLLDRRDTVRRNADGLIASYGNNALLKAQIACADTYTDPDPMAFRQAGRVLEEVRRRLNASARG